jgi:hypothetical protein
MLGGLLPLFAIVFMVKKRYKSITVFQASILSIDIPQLFASSSIVIIL